MQTQALMGDMVNLIVDLHDERFDEAALARAHRETESAGFIMETVSPGSDAYLAWIDDEFGGCWSSEAFAGSSVVTKSGDAFVGFAAYGARGLKFSWLRGLGAREGVGIFGPFGVARAFRGCPAGPQLLVAALASLRRSGYTQALIPAVEHEKVIAYYEHYADARVRETFTAKHWFQHRYRVAVAAPQDDANRQLIVDAVREGRLPLEIVSMQDAPELVLVLGDARAVEQPNAEEIVLLRAFLPLDPAERAGFALGATALWGQNGNRVVFSRKPLVPGPHGSEAATVQRLAILEHEVLTAAILRWVYER